MAHMSQSTIKPTKWHVCPVKTQISLGIYLDWSDPLLCAQWVAKNPRRLQAGSEDSEQTLGGCQGWSDSLQGAQGILFFMSCSGSYMYYDWCYSLYLHRTIEFISFFQSILSQSYKATVFCFDNISFLEHVSNQLFLPNERSISQASLPHNGINNLFPTVQETNHFTEVGWLKKNEMHGDVPVSDMWHAFRAA